MKQALLLLLASAFIISPGLKLHTQSGPTHDVTRKEVTGSNIINECTGEIMPILQGTEQTQSTELRQTSKIILSETVTLSGIVAQAADGTIYRGGGTFSFHFILPSASDTRYIYNAISSLVFTTSGTGNNSFAKAYVHTTINARGEITTELDRIIMECK